MDQWHVMICPYCHGSGATDNQLRICRWCGGKKIVKIDLEEIPTIKELPSEG